MRQNTYRQPVADLLSNIKTTDGASGTMIWKEAANCLENGPGDYIARREVALAAKISCFDTCMKAVMDTIYVVGRCAILSVLFWNLQNRDEFDAVALHTMPISLLRIYLIRPW